VGNPSNVTRMQFLYGNDVQKMKSDIDAMAISDEETLNEIRETYLRKNYILDPHTAVGVCAARKRSKNLAVSNQQFIVAATAHYGKFPEVVEKAIGEKISLPPSLQRIFPQEKKNVVSLCDFHSLKKLFLSAE